MKRYIPPSILQKYHFAMAKGSALWYRNPSDKLIVIGITGTGGKSSTVSFVAQLLTELGQTVGYTSTAGFSVAGRFIENALKMTMPGRWTLQKLLAQMLDAGCRYAILETTSQGLAQHRHVGINYDAVVFTNLWPEHIEAHGSFEKYKAAKGILFAHLMRRSHKVINGQRVPKVSVLNAGNEHVGYYASFPADRHVFFAWNGPTSEDRVVATLLSADASGSTIEVNGHAVQLAMTAEFERVNAVAAMATVYALGFSMADIARAAHRLKSVAGRFESIDLGQPFKVIVDYAFEPYALESLFRSVTPLQPKRIIGVHGSTGGGRDVRRRPLIGRVAAQNEDIVLVTNEDPYDDNPRQIMDDVAAGAREVDKVDGENLFILEDRQAAIDRAIALAKPGDVVLITGKGSEPVMAVANGKKIPWDDRDAARKALKKAGFGV